MRMNFISEGNKMLLFTSFHGVLSLKNNWNNRKKEKQWKFGTYMNVYVDIFICYTEWTQKMSKTDRFKYDQENISRLSNT